MLVNAYATVREVAAPTFPVSSFNHRALSDPELRPHLNGFCGYVFQLVDRRMTADAFHLIQHIGRVKHHFSFEVDERHASQLAAWAHAANAILFMRDSTIRDPQGRLLIAPAGARIVADGELPFPPDAVQRKLATERALRASSIPVLEALPPSIGSDEALLRDPKDVALRAIALFAVAARAETLASGDPLPSEQILERLPECAAAFTPEERAFFEAISVDEERLPAFTWRYESVAVLLWALGHLDALPPAGGICDVPGLSRLIVQGDRRALVSGASLRSVDALLDELDRSYRMLWAVREARRVGGEAPAGVDGSVVFERNYALRWLTGADPAEWDDVDTPS